MLSREFLIYKFHFIPRTFYLQLPLYTKDLVKKSADPFTPRRISSLESKYVPQTSFDKSNISGGTCVLTSWTTFCAILTFSLNGSLRLTLTSMSFETSFATGRLEGDSLKGSAFLHLLPDNFSNTKPSAFGVAKENLFELFSCLRYSRFPAVNLKNDVTCNLPVTPALSWGHSWPIIILKSMSETNESGEFDFGPLDIVRHASPMSTRAGGWRRVNPMCLPVQYNRRHFPGNNSSQFCKSNRKKKKKLSQFFNKENA